MKFIKGVMERLRLWRLRYELEGAYESVQFYSDLASMASARWKKDWNRVNEIRGEIQQLTLKQLVNS